MTQTHWATASEIADKLRRRKLSSTEYTRLLLERIVRLQPTLHAFTQLDEEGAMRSATLADREMAAGRSRGPLHGIVVAIKDVIDVAGLYTTCHSKIRLGARANNDALVVARLREAGAVIIGKLASHEFSFGGPSIDLPFPPARNPWNTAYHPGGSSSGAGVALAAGLVPLAIGTDAAGSIRGPAGSCGVIGLKPTFGLVSRQGVFPLAFSLDHIGPMARCISDIEVALAIIGGRDDPEHAPMTGSTNQRAMSGGRTVRGLRVGYVDTFNYCLQPSGEVREALTLAREALVEEGIDVREIELPMLHEALAINRIILNCEAWSLHRSWLCERPEDYGAATRRRLFIGAFHSAGDYVDAQRRRSEIATLTDALFEEVDVILCPNSMDAPCRVDDGDETRRTHPRQARALFNLTGHPALAMMAGRSMVGLPLSLQFVGRHFDEQTLLAVGAAFEHATGWHHDHPEL